MQFNRHSITSFSPFIYLIITLILLTSTSPVSATSFTSFRVTDQIEEAAYVIRGRIGNTEVREESTTRRPYTYWEFSVVESYSDDKLSGNIEIRQPGGEIDGIGYYMSSTARFTDGEEVVVMLRDTQESAKEVIGLASGKYTVKEGPGGDEYLENGLGFPLRNPKGGYMSPKQFGELVDRVLSRDATEEDQKIRVNPVYHANHLHKPKAGFPAFTPPNTPKPDTGATTVVVNNSDLSTKKSLEPEPTDADRNLASSAGLSWLQSVLIMIGFLAVLLISFLILRPRE